MHNVKYAQLAKEDLFNLFELAFCCGLLNDSKDETLL
jgi:hypothetical protein